MVHGYPNVGRVGIFSIYVVPLLNLCLIWINIMYSQSESVYLVVGPFMKKSQMDMYLKYIESFLKFPIK